MDFINDVLDALVPYGEYPACRAAAVTSFVVVHGTLSTIVSRCIIRTGFAYGLHFLSIATIVLIAHGLLLLAWPFVFIFIGIVGYAYESWGVDVDDANYNFHVRRPREAERALRRVRDLTSPVACAK